MIIIGAGVLLFVGGCLLCNRFETTSVLMCCVGVVLIAVVTITIPVSQIEERAAIIKFTETKATVLRARESGAWVERAALQVEIIKGNKWLAEVKYWNNWLWFDLWIPDAVDDLEPIR